MNSGWIRRVCRVYAVLLCAYPKEFRTQFGRGMQQVFRDGCRAAAATKHLPRFLLVVFRDWLRTSLREWLAAFRNPEIPVKGWWLLALCGVLDAACAATNALMVNPWANFIWDMSALALAAGACAIAAGLWNSGRGNTWLLALHGFALIAFGLIGVSPLVRGPLGFRPVSLLFALMAISVGAFALGLAGGRLLSLCGAVSLGFACSFLAVGFGWVRLGPPPAYWIWMSSYFAVTALCMWSMAVHFHGSSQPGTAPARA